MQSSLPLQTVIEMQQVAPQTVKYGSPPVHSSDLVNNMVVLHVCLVGCGKPNELAWPKELQVLTELSVHEREI